MLGKGIRAPDHVTIWRRTCARSVSIDGDHIAIETTDDKIHVLVADSTGITTTGKGKWIEIKWNVKSNFIKLHIMVDEESQQILAFRITDVNGGDAKNLPGMLDEALEKLGIPLEDRDAEPAVSVEVDSVPADDNTTVKITEFVCDCGCSQTVVKERRVTNVKKPPVAMARADGRVWNTRGLFARQKAGCAHHNTCAY